MMVNRDELDETCPSCGAEEVYWLVADDAESVKCPICMSIVDIDNLLD